MSVSEDRVRTQDICPGARRDIVERIDRELHKEISDMDDALETRNFPAALHHAGMVRFWRGRRQDALDASILDLME